MRNDENMLHDHLLRYYIMFPFATGNLEKFQMIFSLEPVPRFKVFVSFAPEVVAVPKAKLSSRNLGKSEKIGEIMLNIQKKG